MNCTVTKAFKERFFGVGLNGSLCNFISFMAWLRRLVTPSPGDPSQRKFLSLESTERGIASMSAGDEALRNALVAHATAQDVPSVECAKDGIAFDQKAQRFCVLALATSE
jgi:hypothetical protein